MYDDANTYLTSTYTDTNAFYYFLGLSGNYKISASKTGYCINNLYITV